jgi:hypothetical protein
LFLLVVHRGEATVARSPGSVDMLGELNRRSEESKVPTYRTG